MVKLHLNSLKTGGTIKLAFGEIQKSNKENKRRLALIHRTTTEQPNRKHSKAPGMVYQRLRSHKGCWDVSGGL